jgi:hypothetical protein
MAEPALYRPGVVPLVGERVAAGVPQHVRVGLELQPGDGRRPLGHAREAGRGERGCVHARSAPAISLRSALESSALMRMCPAALKPFTSITLVATGPRRKKDVVDPVTNGIVTRLDRPGGNVTGFANLEASLGGKWLELLSEIAPGLKRVVGMFNPDNSPGSTFMPSFETAARSLKVAPIIAPVHSDAEIETAIIALGREPGGGLVAIPSVFMTAHHAQIILAAARNNIPAVYAFSYHARDGGLVSYGPDQLDNWRGAASYVDRILRGAKPGDLPVQLPTKFEMFVNLKTAKALGLTVPQSILLRADEVLE